MLTESTQRTLLYTFVRLWVSIRFCVDMVFILSVHYFADCIVLIRCKQDIGLGLREDEGEITITLRMIYIFYLLFIVGNCIIQLELKNYIL